MNLFMQYNLAHSDYNSAKFNWIVYSRRSRYDQSEREPRAACPYFTSFSLPSSPAPVAGRNKRDFIEFPRRRPLKNGHREEDTRPLSARVHVSRQFCHFLQRHRYARSNDYVIINKRHVTYQASSALLLSPPRTLPLQKSLRDERTQWVRDENTSRPSPPAP